MSRSAVRDPIRDAVTFLFVPGTHAGRFDKAVASGADVVILDLEDAVAPDDKAIARERVAAWLENGGRAAVRVNNVGTPWFEADVRAAARATAIVLPKAEGTVDIDRVASLSSAPIPVIPLVETARGVLASAEICTAERVARVGFGNVDLAADIGVEPTSRLALAAARSQLVYASRAARRAGPIDGVTTTIDDFAVLREDVLHARELGFSAKLLIHPTQVDEVASAFAPTSDELRWATGVLDSIENGVGVHEGHMIDEPVLARARQIIGQAR